MTYGLNNNKKKQIIGRGDAQLVMPIKPLQLLCCHQQNGGQGGLIGNK